MMKLLQTGTFLKDHRRSIDRAARVLGSHQRLASRYGKPVTQEEIAEAVGVSRVWYAMLESGAAVRTTPQLLGKMAGALMLDASERETLFRLALPDLKLSADSAAALDGWAVLRTFTKRLWSATSQAEALALVCEELGSWFDDAPLVTRLQRRSPGAWDWTCVVDRGPGERTIKAWEALPSVMTPAQVDQCFLFPQLARAGDVGSNADHPASIQQALFEAYQQRDLIAMTSFIQGRVCTRNGTIAGFHVTHAAGHAYSRTDRAIVGTVAEITSLALP